MDFFTRQERSRRVSRALLVMFVLAVAAIVLAITSVAGVAMRVYLSQSDPSQLAALGWRDWAAAQAIPLLLIAAGTLGFIALASLYRSASLAGGGGQVARMLGATEVTAGGEDPLRRRLVNVVEEMALASGLPVPEIYVLEQESGINAFAAGLASSNAAVAVTRGALEQLTRAELQGVIAHEFSHIANGDMRLNQQLIGLSFGILVLTIVGRWLLRAARYGRRGRNSGGVAAALAIGGALTVIGAIGVLFSRLIKAAVSRQREALADASAVQFTRDPSGLAGALKRIGGYTAALTAVDSEEVAHMLFERSSRAFRGWFATHPPLIERIRTLDPTFDPGDYPPPREAPPAAETAAPPAGAAALHALDATAATPSDAPLLESAGTSAPPALAEALHAAIPAELLAAAHDRDASGWLIVALALEAHGAERRQLQLLESQLGTERTARCRALRQSVERLDRRLRLPLLELAVPALRRRPESELRYLLALIERVIELGEQEALFDYLLPRVLASYLGWPPEPPGNRRERLSANAAVIALLETIAAFGHEDADTAAAAFAAGLAALQQRTEPAAGRFEPLAKARDIDRLDAALARLVDLKPRARQRVLAAALATIRHDRRIGLDEAELFRAIAATLGCPLPPAAGRTPDASL